MTNQIEAPTVSPTLPPVEAAASTLRQSATAPAKMAYGTSMMDAGVTAPKQGEAAARPQRQDILEDEGGEPAVRAPLRHRRRRVAGRWRAPAVVHRCRCWRGSFDTEQAVPAGRARSSGGRAGHVATRCALAERERSTRQHARARLRI